MKIPRVSFLLLAMAAASEGAILERQWNLGNFNVTFNSIPPDSIMLNEVAQIYYNSSLDSATSGHVDNLALLLLQTTAVGEVLITSNNTVLLVNLLPDACIYTKDIQDCSNPPEAIKAGQPILALFQEAQGYSATDNLYNMFFCFATADKAGDLPVCNYYSNVFAISDGQSSVSNNAAAMASIPASGLITVTSTITTVLRGTTVPASSTSTFSASSSLISSTVTSSGTTTISTATAASTSATQESGARKSSSLSVGAKVGIALGALALVAALLLLALFFLRRKHSKRTTEHHQPEQVMLRRSMHTDSFGRPNLITEKEDASSSAAALNLSGDSPIHTSNGRILVGAGGETNHLTPTLSHNQPQQLQTRHTVLSPYDPLPSAPYTGTIGTASSIPRRKPAAAAMASTVSAGTGSRTTPSGGSDELEAYHNVPIYGDARHVPQVLSGGGVGVPRSRAPFLSEETEGMTPEEVARLEEEERRIDLAIAEAERR